MKTLTEAVISLDQALQRVRRAHEASWQTGTGEPTSEQVKEMDEGAAQAHLALSFIMAVPSGFPTVWADKEKVK